MSAVDQGAYALVEDGLVHHRSGRLQEARARYEAALARMPRHADAWHLLGVVAMQEQRHADALDLISRAIEISPQATYFDNLGCALRSWGKLAAAVESHEQALALDPHHFRAHNNLGLALMDMRLPAAAAAGFRKSLAINPEFAEAHSNLGNVLRELGEFEAAADHCRKAIALQGGFGQAHNNLGNALKMQRQLTEAAACYEEALRLLPHEAQVALNLGIVRRELGDHAAAIEAFRRSIALRPTWGEAWSNLLFTLSFAQHVAPLDYLTEALAFGRMAAAQARPFTDWLVARAPGAPLRIGFVSGDLRTHPVGFFLESVLTQLDPARVQLFAYSTRPYEDELTQRLKPRFAQWRTLVGLTDEAAAATIRNDGIHILLDMSGHTDSNRLPVFAWKPAPVQASWIGYFASTGLTAIDYVLGDQWVLPPVEAEHFVERPWRLPHGYLCFTPPEPAVAIDVNAATDATRPLTFGCFSDLVKVNDRVVAVWARILHAVPGARLFLKAQQLADEAQRAATLQRFAAHGIAPERVLMEGPSPRAEYLSAYNRVDISLSPFPYPGGTTTAESLWMGVPVLCRHGDRFLGHLCESVLQSADLGDWIAADDDAYVARALAAASERDALAALRRQLRERVLNSSLCNPDRFARTLEGEFERMWRARNL
ncbi:O-linked N-acetylglucosamine transferase, SPINDLY family protein [Trinickia soli]|uniref:protein O-GlcNAc transferase n=1 Tax=Trinickia soli TaxID=380675 RepID=A0A2N7VTZ7_9BURK|nr:tetratricopeptide repeat protein [Trinickia soli]PMS20630.1 glycosyltransferase [Trinickia soli]CAB3697600.1 Photosystem I assembly protein Ycf3 [Trinickia soli]